MPANKDSIGIEPSLAHEIRQEKLRTRKPMHVLMQEAWDAYKQKRVIFDERVKLTDEETAVLEGVLDMLRHPRDKQDEIMIHALAEIIKIRNNAKRTR